MSAKTRYRILWPRPSDPRHDNVSHWVFSADRTHKPIMYGCAAIVFYKDGHHGETYQLHK
jgi:hypothetical protein